MAEYRNCNIFALQGDTETSDADVCATLGLDPSWAGTPAINNAAIKAMHRKNYDGYVAQGLPPEDALAKADENAAIALDKVNKLFQSANKT